MSNQRVHVLVLADGIVQLIKDNLATPLGLQICTVGDLAKYPLIEELHTQCPAVFVKPYPSSDFNRVATGETYDVDYFFRIVYVRKWSNQEEPVRVIETDAAKIAELLIDNLRPPITLVNGQINWSLMASIEHEPDEDIFVSTFNTNLEAMAIKYLIQVRTRK